MADETQTLTEQTIMIAGKRVSVADPNAAALFAYNTMMMALSKEQRTEVLAVMEDGAALRAAETQLACAHFRYAFTDAAGDFVCICGHRATAHEPVWP